MYNNASKEELISCRVELGKGYSIFRYSNLDGERNPVRKCLVFENLEINFGSYELNLLFIYILCLVIIIKITIQ